MKLEGRGLDPVPLCACRGVLTTSSPTWSAGPRWAAGTEASRTHDLCLHCLKSWLVKEEVLEKVAGFGHILYELQLEKSLEIR